LTTETGLHKCYIDTQNRTVTCIRA